MYAASKINYVYTSKINTASEINLIMYTYECTQPLKLIMYTHTTYGRSL